MIKNYTPKQIEKYKRQKYISTLSKCTKNLFKIFRNKESNYETYKKRFIELKKELDSLEKIRLNSEYSRKCDEYIHQLYKNTIENPITNEQFIELKAKELTNLNRLQKIKNQKKYSKEKYKSKFF